MPQLARHDDIIESLITCMKKYTNLIKNLRLQTIVAIVAGSLLISGMNFAEATPKGANDYGKNTASKMKAAEIKDTKNNPDKAKSVTHKGDQKQVKNEPIKNDKRASEALKAAEKVQQTYYKNPYKPNPFK